MLSDWCTFIVREADHAFLSGADLAALLTAVSAIETYLRGESGNRLERLIELINRTGFTEEEPEGLHRLRGCCNGWVHVADTHNHERLRAVSSELQEMAFLAMRLLRRTLYSAPWV